MQNPAYLLVLSVVSLGTLSARADDDSSQVTREYRALEAKRVSIRPGVRVDPAKLKAISKNDFSASDLTAEQLRMAAWNQFDNRDWEKATDAFLSALEKDPESTEAAEGLAMSVFHSGDYASAYRLGEELSNIMPTVKRIISETVLADVRYMISKEEFEAAEEFLSHFPKTDSAFFAAHQLARNATTIQTALGPDGDVTAEPDAVKPKRLAKN